MTSKRYDSLDGLRALACIGIILMHVQSNIAVKPSENFLTTNIIGFCGNLVLLFMMVSSFSLCCGYFEKFRSGNICIDDFYKKRWRRIWPFFALLVLIDVVFCIIKQHFTFDDVVLGELWEAFADLTLAFGLIPGNGIEVIGVGWFLGVIFLFYMVFPYFTFLIGNPKRAWLSMAVSILLCIAISEYFATVKSAVACGNSLIINCMPYFIAGGLLYIYRERSDFRQFDCKNCSIGFYDNIYDSFFRISRIQVSVCKSRDVCTVDYMRSCRKFWQARKHIIEQQVDEVHQQYFDGNVFVSHDDVSCCWILAFR